MRMDVAALCERLSWKTSVSWAIFGKQNWRYGMNGCRLSGVPTPDRFGKQRPKWVGGRGDFVQKGSTQVGLERSLVQILVVVANIKAWSFKDEAGKGSMRTLIGHGWVVPKPGGNRSDDRRKGSWLKFQHTDVKAATQIEVETLAVKLGRVFFSV